MRWAGAVAVVTGGADPLGRALTARLGAAGALLAVVDPDGGAARALAADLPGDSFGVGTDVTDPAALDRLVPAVEQRLGPIDLYWSDPGGGAAAHQPAADAVLPTMARRRRGGFVVVVRPGPQAAAVQAGALALSDRYRPDGVAVCCLPPVGQRPPAPEAVAAAVLDAVAARRFLVLPG